ncbi:Sporulation related domain protein [Grimontia celer]|uniref:Sporulation related domain protein n=1 Tax=Grimontia celer TaxID=1796497 RepID=A0A128FDD1_9GAMM|nr:SPOR domain-containing protein [Grimontia celer]CZF84306.1 Sporulation related domain protein [Grimontia celer]
MRSRRFSVLNIFMLSSFLVFCSSAFASSDINKLCLSSTSPEGDQIVGKNCPIGEGLWGRKPAKNGAFWVQCGIYSEIPDKNGKANEVLYRKEGSQYRCLAGPYDSFVDAKNARDNLRTSSEMSDAFIRQIGFKPSIKKRSSKTTVQASKSGIVRQQEQVLGFWAPKPQGMDARYTVNRRDWWRATYEDASNACRQKGRKLVSAGSLRKAIARQRSSDELPALYPYWLGNGHVYDIKLDMSFVAISDTLTLNVLCE